VEFYLPEQEQQQASIVNKALEILFPKSLSHVKELSFVLNDNKIQSQFHKNHNQINRFFSHRSASAGREKRTKHNCC